MGASETRRERKVVTVVFADLVGFTGRAETLDPEEVDAILRPYHERLRAELERHGGTVEKFIGDAVMAVFGAPVAHEDDPERAVRAALAIRDALGEELELRIAVNTGKALVTLGARPSEGEAMVAGDVVNTAARLQAAAPVNGVLVGEQTYRATSAAIDYREAEPVEAKGKAEPVPVWEAVKARARFGVDVEQRSPAPLVGRQREVDALLGALERVRADRAPQLVTLVGVPGMGKSRLVFELFQAIEADPELVYWRQGRSLPYGEGVTYWALGEMVKAQADILDTDSADEAAAKLDQVLRDVVGDDAEWIGEHVRPLIGLAGEGSGDRSSDAFGAWRRFFEALAEQRLLVLVFEDLHWADDGVLDFVDHLVDWADDVPILVVCTARPELLERRPGWSGGKLNASTIALAPLADDDAARIVAAVIDQSVLPAETQAALLSRAGGNPLYAEQYARMFLERGSAEDLPLPETVQGIIAARLDGLSPGEKELLQNAAVVGKVFWPGALHAIGSTGELDELLHSLGRKEFVRRERRSSVGAETEYAFRHVLVRDVAYGQIPHADRTDKHRLAAEWIESLSERSEDVAEMLAHHYSAALEYARAAGRDTADLAGPARLALRDAAERALALNAYVAAVRFYEAALELWPPGDEQRPHVLLGYARALDAGGDQREDVLVEARDGLLAQGRRELAAEAEMLMVWMAVTRGRRDLASQHGQRALALVRDAPASRSKALVLGRLAIGAMLAGNPEEARSFATLELEIGDALDQPDLRAHALNTLGWGRWSLGDSGGLDDLEQSIALAEAANSAESVRGYKNLGSLLAQDGQLARAFELQARGLSAATRFGDLFNVRWFRGERALECYYRGEWDEAGGIADEFVAEVEAGSPHYMEVACRVVRSLIRLARGDRRGALDDTEQVLVYARGIQDAQVLYPSLAARARVLLSDGRTAEATALVEELLGSWRGGSESGQHWFADLIFVLTALGRGGELLELAARSTLQSPWLDAACIAASGDYGAAADTYAAIGSKPDEAYARLRAGDEANVRRALEFYRSVGAAAYVREAETLLATSRSA